MILATLELILFRIEKSAKKPTQLWKIIIKPLHTEVRAPWKQILIFKEGGDQMHIGSFQVRIIFGQLG
jgi:hypothetical protein